MIQGLRGILALPADGTYYTGSFEMSGGVSARVSMVPTVVPGSAFDVEVQLEQTIDNLTFTDAGTSLKVDSEAPVQGQVDGIGGNICRARITLTSVSGDPAVVAIEVIPVPNPADPSPPIMIPGFDPARAADLSPLFATRFAQAATSGRAPAAIQPAAPGAGTEPS